MTTLQRSIIATVAYFDLLDYPLTLTELWHNLWQAPANITLAEVHDAITVMPQLSYQTGLVVFSDREQLIQTRAERYLVSDAKYKKRLPYIALLTYLPWVEAIFIVNSLAYYNANDTSDIDLCIITKPGKIWSTRFFTTTLAKLLRLRPKPNDTKDTLCLSFYLTSNTLNLSALLNSPVDIHQAYWLSRIYPIYDPKNSITKIFSANSWLTPLLPYHLQVLPHPVRTIKPSWLKAITQSLLGLFSFEPLLRAIQLKILPAKLKNLSTQPEQVVIISDTLLKFHTHDPRPELERQWLERIERYTSFPNPSSLPAGRQAIQEEGNNFIN